MKVDKLTQAYLRKAQVRLEALHFFKDRQAYSDVVREAQELVELLLKAVLRAAGVEVPKIHDVGRVLEKHREHLPPELTEHLADIRRISKRLRKERELSFYGAEDFIPTEEYDMEDADLAIADAAFVYRIVSEIFDKTEAEEPT
ncbi:MAG: HEPN domain-containing protein [Desulfosoma sp.]